MGRVNARRGSLGKTLFDEALKDELAKLDPGARPGTRQSGVALSTRPDEANLKKSVERLEQEIAEWRAELQALTAIVERLGQKPREVPSPADRVGSGSAELARVRSEVGRLREQIEQLQQDLATAL